MTKKAVKARAAKKPAKASKGNHGGRGKRLGPPAKVRAARPASALAVATPAGLASGDDALEPRIADPRAAAADALTRLRSLETLADAYVAWAELRALHAQAQRAYGAERERIEGQGEFLLGAVRAARDFSTPKGRAGAALAHDGEVDAFITRTTGRLEAARQQLGGAIERAQTTWGDALDEARQTVIARVERTVKHARPALRLLLRGLAGNRRILHLERLAGDAPVLAHAVLTGAVPSRYEFLFDDSTEDVAQAPAALYAEEGVEAADLRGTPANLFAMLAGAPAVFPSKGMIPFRVPQPAATLSVRFLQRGPVAEAEVADGDGWRSVLSVEEAEVIAGWLIKLQLEGKLSVSLARG